jgi:hypothetical protein|tara:strand:- start:758 stop:1231 length:474 start_codon:yes stop_codon:yes gene_type:complete
MKLTKIVKDIVLEGNLSDYDGYNTEAALSKEKEIKNKNVKPEDAITDLDLNTLNRNQTIKEYGYGPLNPDDEKGSKKFWEQKAELWNTTPEAAKASRCGNCGAFDQKKSTLSKIEKAIGEDGKTIVKNANIGFCEFFWFKCAGARTCDAWVSGGPIK